MATVKVFIPTYRRHALLKRSIRSLQAQIFKDWVAEIHNDDPEDEFPSAFINSIGDSRFTVNNHRYNLGAVASFNLMYKPTDATYVCLLEDDNWWEESFLETMVRAMERYPECQVGFCNSRLWQEKSEHEWQLRSEPLWPADGPATALIYFPRARHIYGYHHSNCSTIIRAGILLPTYQAPQITQMDFIESVQERSFPHPLLFVNQTLSNFALTKVTHRRTDLGTMYVHYVLLIDSFFSSVGYDEQFTWYLWNESRQDKLHSFLKLLYAGVCCKASRKLLREASFREWMIFILYNIKHPGIFFACMRAKKKYASLWAYLVKGTNRRSEEQRPGSNTYTD